MSRPMSTAEAVAMETYKQALEEHKEFLNKVEEEALNTMQRLSNGVEQCRLAVEKANQEGNQSQQEQAQKDLDEANATLWSEGGNNTGGPEAYQMIFGIASQELLRKQVGQEQASGLTDEEEGLANFVARVVYGRLYEMPVSFACETPR